MKKILLLFVLVPCFLLCLTHTVKLDGTGNFTNIQAAINASSNGDIVLVYPGRYNENLVIENKNITLTSLYAQSPQQTYIDNTLILGNLNTCIKIENCNEIEINGFTISNNENNGVLTEYFGGGGLFLQHITNLTLQNLVIKDCLSISGGGINGFNNNYITYKNVKIYNNLAKYSG